MTSTTFREVKLPNGSILRNRIVKAAMNETMADARNHNQPSKNMIRLYEEWGKGGSGLIISGNIFVDPRALSTPCDVVLASDAGPCDEAIWKAWIRAAEQSGSQFWFQVNHPGRQMKAGSGFTAYGPSPIPVDLGRYSGMLEKPKEMDEARILDAIERFAWTAKKAEHLGSSGVELHGAHGYLISQFLSPLTNHRMDRWGGTLENRARFLFEVVKAVRAAVSPSFGVALKINSSDFQRGGFGPKDLEWVVQQLNHMQLDFIELSGGSFEQPAMTGESPAQEKKSERTLARKAYFLEAAEDLASIAQMPIVVTGGISKRETLEQVTNAASGVRLAGIGTALGIMPDLPNRWAAGEDPQPRLTSQSWVLPTKLRPLGGIAAVEWNLHLLGSGRNPWPGVWPAFAVLVAAVNEKWKLRDYKTWSQKLVRGMA